MIKGKTFAIIGGDRRQVHLANTLAGKESECNIYAMFLEKEVHLSRRIHYSDDLMLVLPQSDILIFSLPMLSAAGYLNTPLSDRDVKWEECLDYISPNAVVLAGMVPDHVYTAACRHGFEVIDYYRREEYAVFNAVPTAEGAVEIALRETPTTLFGSTCLITGFGRVSKTLARLLRAFGAKVRVVARRYSDLAWAQVYGCEAVHIADLSASLMDVDILFNTVPAVILDEEKLAKLGRHCLVIDLASKPGGVDFETAKVLGLKTIWALSLPGKVAPISAGEITLDTIFHILEEKGLVGYRNQNSEAQREE